MTGNGKFYLSTEDSHLFYRNTCGIIKILGIKFKLNLEIKAVSQEGDG